MNCDETLKTKKHKNRNNICDLLSWIWHDACLERWCTDWKMKTYMNMNLAFIHKQPHMRTYSVNRWCMNTRHSTSWQPDTPLFFAWLPHQRESNNTDESWDSPRIHRHEIIGHEAAHASICASLRMSEYLMRKSQSVCSPERNLSVFKSSNSLFFKMHLSVCSSIGARKPSASLWTWNPWHPTWTFEEPGRPPAQTWSLDLFSRRCSWENQSSGWSISGFTDHLVGAHQDCAVELWDFQMVHAFQICLIKYWVLVGLIKAKLGKSVEKVGDTVEGVEA